MDPDSAQFTARAPAYALESDDEDDDDDVSDAGARAPEPAVTYVPAHAALPTGHAAYFLLGEAGEALPLALPSPADAIAVLVDGVQAGVVYSLPTASVVLLDASLPFSTHYPLALSLLSLLAPSRTTILSTYSLQSHIPSSPSPPPLYLSSSSSAATTLPSSWKPFSPPNLHHGLAAALLTLAVLRAPAPDSAEALLLLVPTTTPPPPLARLAPRPDPDGDLARHVRAVAHALGWDWAPAAAARRPTRHDDPWLWLETKRREKRKEAVGAMYL